MRVLIAVYGFPPTHVAGAERISERYAMWLSRNGHDVEVFTVEDLSSPGFRMETQAQDGFPIHRLYYDVKATNAPANVMYDFAPIGEAVREVMTRKPFDLVHVVGGFVVGPQVERVAHSLGVPVMVSLMEYWYLCARINMLYVDGEICSGPESLQKCAACLMEDKRRYQIPAKLGTGVRDVFWKLAEQTPLLDEQIAWLEARKSTVYAALNAMDFVVVTSRFLKKVYGQFGFDVQDWVLSVTGVGEKGMPKQARVYNPDEGLHVGFLGQMKPGKGVDLVVDAVMGLVDEGAKVTLDLWGSKKGSEKYADALERRTADYPMIRWRGVFSGIQVFEKLADFDVLVVPSRYYENTPGTILEAFKFGLPVVTANRGGMAELVQHEVSGLLFKPDSALDLKAQLRRILDEPALLERFKQGLPYVDSAEEEAARVFSFYERAVAEWQVKQAK